MGWMPRTRSLANLRDAVHLVQSRSCVHVGSASDVDTISNHAASGIDQVDSARVLLSSTGQVDAGRFGCGDLRSINGNILTRGRGDVSRSLNGVEDMAVLYAIARRRVGLLQVDAGYRAGGGVLRFAAAVILRRIPSGVGGFTAGAA